MKKIRLILIIVLLASCSDKLSEPDAYGNFEAYEIIVSSENIGAIIFDDIEEGQEIEKGKLVFISDTAAINLAKEQLKAQKKAISSKFSNILAQVSVLQKQKENISVELNRVQNLLKDSAITKQKYDEVKGKAEVIDKQIEQVRVQNQSVFEEINVFEKQFAILNDKLGRAKTYNPVNGTVLVKYANLHEMTMPGKPLYKISDLSSLNLRAYVSGSQLNEIKTGQKVKVYIDKNEKENLEFEGTITWISSKAEFTPKIIQTKEERVDLVYAVKIKVKNNGSLKIGMPAEVKFK